MNKMQLLGRLTKDPELTQTKSKITQCRFNIASKSKVKTEDGESKTDFFICVAWREKAELIEKYCQKGDLLYLSGYMTSRNYEDTNGVDRTIWEFNVEDVEFCTTKAEREKSQTQEKGKSKKASSQPELEPIDPDEDDDLPF